MIKPRSDRRCNLDLRRDTRPDSKTDPPTIQGGVSCTASGAGLFDVNNWRAHLHLGILVYRDFIDSPLDAGSPTPVTHWPNQNQFAN